MLKHHNQNNIVNSQMIVLFYLQWIFLFHHRDIVWSENKPQPTNSKGHCFHLRFCFWNCFTRDGVMSRKLSLLDTEIVFFFIDFTLLSENEFLLVYHSILCGCLFFCGEMEFQFITFHLTKTNRLLSDWTSWRSYCFRPHQRPRYSPLSAVGGTD